MAAKKKVSQRGKAVDTNRNELVRVGANVSQLAMIFDRDINAVKRLIAKHNIAPTLTESGRELYAIRDVAPYVIDISAVVDIAEIIKTTSLKKLPPELTKNFWDAANSRKKHLEDNGELWRTEAVLEVLLDVFKVMRRSVTLFIDTIGDRTETTPKQRQLITEMGDGLLASLRDDLIEKFELYETEAEEHDDHDDGLGAEEEDDE